MCWLWKRAGSTKHVKSTGPEADGKEEEVRREVMDNTIQEGHNGWVSGHYSEHELTTLLGPAGDRTVACPETVKVGGVHRIARLLENKAVKVALFTGEAIRCGSHEARDRLVRLVGKCYDLEAACKQCLLAEHDGSVGVVLRIQATCILPRTCLSAAGSVVQFNRVAAGIRQVMCCSLSFPRLNYYIDFPVVLPEGGRCHQEHGQLDQMEMKRWGQIRELRCFFQALGVFFDVEQALQAGKLVVKNTEPRIDDCNHNDKQRRRSRHSPTCSSTRWTALVLSGAGLQANWCSSTVAQKVAKCVEGCAGQRTSLDRASPRHNAPCVLLHQWFFSSTKIGSGQSLCMGRGEGKRTVTNSTC